MQTPDSQIIAKRFFEVLDKIIEAKIIRGVQTFTRKYGINRWNFNKLRVTPESDMFQAAWLEYLVRDFMISPRWLLTGQGEMYEYGWDADKVRDIFKREKEQSKEKRNNPDKPRRGRPRKIQEPKTQLELDL